MDCVQAFWLISIILIVYLDSYVLSSSDEAQNGEQFCTITTESGLIRGKSNVTLFDAKVYYSFRGVPYAKPPINERRFKVNFKNSKNFVYRFFFPIFSGSAKGRPMD